MDDPCNSRLEVFVFGDWQITFVGPRCTSLILSDNDDTNMPNGKVIRDAVTRHHPLISGVRPSD